MRLESKGEIRSPPKLKGPAEAVSLQIQSWRGVISATHWYLYDRTQVDGADFYVGEKELGHIHLDGELHLGLTAGLCLNQAEQPEPGWFGDCLQGTREPLGVFGVERSLQERRTGGGKDGDRLHVLHIDRDR